MPEREKDKGMYLIEHLGFASCHFIFEHLELAFQRHHAQSEPAPPPHLPVSTEEVSQDAVSSGGHHPDTRGGPGTRGSHASRGGESRTPPGCSTPRARLGGRASRHGRPR